MIFTPLMLNFGRSQVFHDIIPYETTHTILFHSGFLRKTETHIALQYV